MKSLAPGRPEVTPESSRLCDNLCKFKEGGILGEEDRLRFGARGASEERGASVVMLDVWMEGGPKNFHDGSL